MGCNRMASDTQSKVFCYTVKALNIIYRLLILVGLFWIGYSLQSIAVSLNTPIEACLVDQSGDGIEQQDDQPRIIKPFMHRGVL